MKENPTLKKERFELGNSYSSIDKDEIENEYDYERKINYPNFTTSNGLFFILMGTVVSALGNSLDSLSTIAFLQPFCTFVGFEIIEDKLGLHTSLFLVWISQSVGFTIAFNGVLGYPNVSLTTTFLTFFLSLLIWMIFIVFCFIPHHNFSRKFPDSILTPLILPSTYTMVSTLLLSEASPQFLSIADAVLDYGPLRQSASIFGWEFINFIVIFLSNVFGFLYLDINRKSIWHLIKVSVSIVGLLFLICNYDLVSNRFYQKNITASGGLEFYPDIKLSCLFGQQILSTQPDWDVLWNSTIERLKEKDDFILWSEESLSVFTENEENALIEKAKGLVIQYGSHSFLGVTYLITTFNISTGIYSLANRFALVSPEGTLAWKYQKAYPVPFVEANVQPGPAVLPIYESSRFGKLSGAICFDMDFSNYILNAGKQNVNIFLQPSWTWGDIGTRHFEDNSIRAVENGFTLLRCSSDGESGIVGPTGIVLSRQYTGHNPADSAVFQAQLMPNIPTIFTRGGYLFQYICLVFSIFIIFIPFLYNKLSEESTKVLDLCIMRYSSC